MSFKNQINRLQDLYTVLNYCSESQQAGSIYIFKIGERILINQERGSIYSQIDDNAPSVREYTSPANVEAKVRFVLEKIRLTGWQPLTIE
jgi:hypothetical protein